MTRPRVPRLADFELDGWVFRDRTHLGPPSRSESAEMSRVVLEVVSSVLGVEQYLCRPSPRDEPAFPGFRFSVRRATDGFRLGMFVIYKVRHERTRDGVVRISGMPMPVYSFPRQPPYSRQIRELIARHLRLFLKTRIPFRNGRGELDIAEWRFPGRGFVKEEGRWPVERFPDLGVADPDNEAETEADDLKARTIVKRMRRRTALAAIR